MNSHHHSSRARAFVMTSLPGMLWRGELPVARKIAQKAAKNAQKAANLTQRKHQVRQRDGGLAASKPLWGQDAAPAPIDLMRSSCRC